MEKQNLQDDQEKQQSNKVYQYQNQDNIFKGLIIQESKQKIFSRKNWKDILKGKEKKYTSFLALQTSIRSGIPYDLRPQIWFWLAELNKNQNQIRQDLYNKLRCSESQSDDQIKKDIPRTYSSYEFFKNIENQDKLFNILRAYSNYDKEIGYIQGMNFIVANIMMNLNLDNYKNISKSFGSQDIDIEEKTFWIWIYICHTKNWREIYKDKLYKVKQLQKYLEKRVKIEVPEIYAHIQKCDVSISESFEYIFFTMLMYHLPFEYTKYIIDTFLLEGETVLYDIIIRMLIICSEEIFSRKSFEELFMFFKKDIINYCFENYKDKIKYLIPLSQIQVINQNK